MYELAHGTKSSIMHTTHIKGRLLDQAMITSFFQLRPFLKWELLLKLHTL